VKRRGQFLWKSCGSPPTKIDVSPLRCEPIKCAEAQSNLAQAYLSPHYDYENPPSFLSPPDEGASRTKRVRNTYTSVNRTNIARRKSAPRSSSRNGLSGDAAAGAGPSVARQPQGPQGSQSNPDRYDRRACAQELQGISLLFCSTWR
jgi:hypothetical protein